MGQLNAFFRSEEGGKIAHWCPACGEMHGFTLVKDPASKKGWHLSGTLDLPTIKPSVRITGKQAIVDEKGEWHGKWVLDSKGKALPYCCHYIITKGQIQFQPDCTHKMRAQTVALPPLPEWMRD